MRKYILTAALLAMAVIAGAVPARRGQWQTVKLSDGTMKKVMLVGDEFNHYWQDADGISYVQDEATGTYSVASSAVQTARLNRAAARRNVRDSRMAARRAKDRSVFQGTKKAIVILAEFTNMKFKDEYNLDFYKKAVNGINYTENGFTGSVRDYFRAQSGGQFDIDFDVVGPCPLDTTYNYYGRNDAYGNDKHAGQMVAEACKWAHEQGVDFSQYDWDGDGEVDQVFVLYAGKGEANGGATSTIWPHKYSLGYSDYGKALYLDGVKVDTYACSSELDGRNKSGGVGTFCHEFSHCMGFPDLYDTGYGGWFGMGSFDLMCAGSYNGDGYTPAGYSAYEKNECGWITMNDMTDIDSQVDVSGLKPVSEYGDAYILRNLGNEDEYYIVEYRKNTGWDACLPAEGVMITHVDYDKDIWEYNVPNTRNGSYYSYDPVSGYVTITNTHQRLTIFHADNNANSEATALYPYAGNDSLTSTSLPAANLYTQNANGKKKMHVDIHDIAISDDGETASMTFVPVKEESVDGLLFYESFDKCASKGGNDGVWSGIAGSPTAVTDQEGWTSKSRMYAGDQCVRLGNVSVPGEAVTPSFRVKGTATLSFKAGAWNAANDGTLLSLSADGGTLADTQFEIAKGAWTECKTTVSGNGLVSLTFKTDKGRFFLDEVKVVDDSATGICINKAEANSNVVTGYFSIDGMRLTAPQKGLNIVRFADGSSRKVLVK